MAGNKNDKASAAASKFQKLVDDREHASFCDFPTLITLRSTCRKLRRYADKAMKLAADHALNNLPMDSEDTDYENPHVSEMVVRKGWSKEYATRERLIAEAMKVVESYMYNYEELWPLARSLLRRNGRVENYDLVDEDGEELGCDDFEVRTTYLIGNANQWLGNRHLIIKDISEQLKDGHGQGMFEDGKNSKLVWHSALALIHGADPTSFRYARLVYNLHHTDCPRGGEDYCLMFKTRNNERIEFYYHARFEWD
eukprot:CAMPEP_0116013978 /NCGR_PEP_ID=MMETSP0321-20121206/6025_1 /TAXON_ID=163516 /ORGANISM="Leptocylindrus danicus var. danicus, Strain B650" /LENGTH=253 /DNA_ID=CAMNT_0003483585 /DNA_START=26 /DNA_END=788 /DNA_ORIENTATION=+